MKTKELKFKQFKNSVCDKTYFYCAGFWNDAHCAQKQAFFCKKPTSGAPRITSPTPYPVGGCANGFQRAPGGRKY